MVPLTNAIIIGYHKRRCVRYACCCDSYLGIIRIVEIEHLGTRTEHELQGGFEGCRVIITIRQPTFEDST